jgi:hypothetical protein
MLFKKGTKQLIKMNNISVAFDVEKRMTFQVGRDYYLSLSLARSPTHAIFGSYYFLDVEEG